MAEGSLEQPNRERVSAVAGILFVAQLSAAGPSSAAVTEQPALAGGAFRGRNSIWPKLSQKESARPAQYHARPKGCDYGSRQHKRRNERQQPGSTAHQFVCAHEGVDQGRARVSTRTPKSVTTRGRVVGTKVHMRLGRRQRLLRGCSLMNGPRFSAASRPCAVWRWVCFVSAANNVQVERHAAPSRPVRRS